jgi:hypothetical protein
MTSVGFGAYLLHELKNQRARYLIFLVVGTGVWAGTYAMDVIDLREI